MSRGEFLQILRRRLSQMSVEEQDRNIAYYDELFNDMMEDGMSETEAVERMGDPNAIADELLAEMPLTTLVKSSVRPSGGWTALSIVLVILGAPLWIPLLIAGVAVVLAVLISLWSVVLAVFAVVLGFGLTAVGLTVGTIFGMLSISGPLLVGLICICVGVCILTALLAGALCKLIARASAWLYRKIKTLFIKRSDEA